MVYFTHTEEVKSTHKNRNGKLKGNWRDLFMNGRKWVSEKEDLRFKSLFN